MGAVIPFPLPVLPPDDLAAAWALADEMWPEYERGLTSPRLRLVEAPLPPAVACGFRGGCCSRAGYGCLCTRGCRCRCPGCHCG